MQIDNEFSVGVDIDTAWKTLTDLEGIAPCLPGAQLTGRDGDTYNGKIKIRVGPVISEYAGTALFSSLDETAYRAVIEAKGKDSRGAGNASATITAHLRGEGARTVVTVSTDLKISGKIAQLGSGMIVEVSKKLLGQFSACLESKLLTPPPATSGTDTATDAPTEPYPGAHAAPTAGPVPTVGSVPGAGPGAGPAADPTTSPPGLETTTAPTVTAPTVAAPTVTAPTVTAPTVTAPTGAAPTVAAPGPEPEPIDLMAFAGNAAAKRLIPVAAALVVAALAYALGRHHR